MTRQEIIADHIATLRNLVANSDATTARLAFVRAIYAALATPGCEAQGVRLVDLPHLAERVAEMADAHEALRAERDELAAEVARLKAAAEDTDNRAFTRGLFWALATHADQCGQEEGIRTTDIRTVAQAIAAGVDEQDAATLKPRFAAVRSREADTKKRREMRAAAGAKS